MKRNFLITLLIVFSLVFTGISFGETSIGTLQVTATVGSVCSVSTLPVNFGTVTGASYTDATGNVTVNCPLNSTYNIAIDAGLDFYAIGVFRALQYSPDQYATYELYQDPNQGTIWGDNDFGGTYPSGNSLPGVGSGIDVSHPVYGRLAPFSGIPEGTLLGNEHVVTVHY